MNVSTRDAQVSTNGKLAATPWSTALRDDMRLDELRARVKLREYIATLSAEERRLLADECGIASVRPVENEPEACSPLALLAPPARKRGRPPTLNLTRAQARVLDAIEAFIQKHKFPPTLREIGQACRIGSTNGVTDHLVRLEKKGYILRTDDAARGIRVLRSSTAAPNRGVPGRATGRMKLIRAMLANGPMTARAIFSVVGGSRKGLDVSLSLAHKRGEFVNDPVKHTWALASDVKPKRSRARNAPRCRRCGKCGHNARTCCNA